MLSKHVMSVGLFGNIIVMLVALRSGIDLEISSPLTLADPSNISRVSSCDGINNGVRNSLTSP